MSKYLKCFLIINLSLSFVLTTKTEATNILFNFYCDKIDITSIENINLKSPRNIDEKYLLSISNQLNQNAEIQNASKDLDSVAKKLDLSNWFRYKLINLYVKQCFPKANEKKSLVFQWYFLNKQGFDARLNLDKKTTLLVQMEKITGSKYNCVDVDGKRFLNLTNQVLTEYTVSRFSMNGKKSMLFKISDLKPPKLTNHILTERKVVVKSTGDSIEIKYIINKTIVEIYNDYPGLGYHYLFNVKLSEQCASSILPLLCSKLITKDTIESVRRILAFTQDVAGYEEDETAFGHEKPMTPEETLFYLKSDCEDKAALFYYLVKTLYGLPLTGLKYPDHVNVAVALKQGSYQNSFKYKDRNYVVCEPTIIGQHEASLGFSNFYLENKKPKIEVEYDPDLDKSNFIYDCK